jgi:hypothetical protein
MTTLGISKYLSIGFLFFSGLLTICRTNLKGNKILPDETKQFILKKIDSVGQLEALLCLRSSPLMDWNAQMIAEKLYTSEAEANLILTQLTAKHFLVPAQSDPTYYRYQPLNAELEAKVQQLAELYKRYLVPISQLIHAKQKSRVQEFANAFIIKKD